MTSPSLDHLIGGERVPSKDTVEVRSPIDDALLGHLAAGGEPEVDAAVAAAREAFPAWAALGPKGRGERLDALAALIRERNDEIAAIETADNGSLLLGNRKRVGPLIHPDHFARVAGFVERALAAGARAMLGGRPSPVGPLWFEPTIIGDVAQDSEIVQREVFGPVLTWQTFTDTDEGSPSPTTRPTASPRRCSLPTSAWRPTSAPACRRARSG